MTTDSHFVDSFFDVGTEPPLSSKNPGAQSKKREPSGIQKPEADTDSPFNNDIYSNAEIALPPPPESKSVCGLNDDLSKQETLTANNSSTEREADQTPSLSHRIANLPHPWLWIGGLAGGYLLLDRMTQ